ncbi:hypothetical protein PhCBS80983_g02879 [Powellomyces hirtus]|uniref:UBX domain-containing protein 11 n=1 Tax=Powellomyces hirtus TaxID=109895 RepID=A0A507E507_9FUNG|nr:hypothetical protein PhCBS80983_g02879 [Powellomyces hirtus]
MTSLIPDDALHVPHLQLPIEPSRTCPPHHPGFVDPRKRRISRPPNMEGGVGLGSGTQSGASKHSETDGLRSSLDDVEAHLKSCSRSSLDAGEERPRSAVRRTAASQFLTSLSSDTSLSTDTRPANLSKPIVRRLEPLMAKKHLNGLPHSIGDSGMDLVTSMAARLSKLEAELRRTKEDLQIKQLTLIFFLVLDGLTHAGCNVRDLGSGTCMGTLTQKTGQEQSTGKIRDLEARCEAFQLQIQEMETFLHRNKMIWRREAPDEVNNRQESRKQHANVLIPPASKLGSQSSRTAHPPPLHPQRNPFPYDFPRLMESIRELNEVAGEGIAAVATDQRGMRRLKAPDALRVTFYRNGFMVASGPFRPYTDRSAQLFMRDLMDGYFPYELKHTFPDGVPFQVRDSHEEWFDTSTTLNTFKAFGGTGCSVVKNTDVDRNLNDAGTPTDASATDDSDESVSDASDNEQKLTCIPVQPGGRWAPDESVVGPAEDPASTHADATRVHTLKTLPTAQSTTGFLSRLPKCIIRNGNILPIRAHIAHLLNGDKDTIPAAPSGPSTVDITVPYQESAEETTSPPRITTLRIHAPDDVTDFLVHARASHTILAVKTAMAEWVTRQIGDGVQWDLRTALQGVGIVYCDAMTLQECDLVGNARMYIRIRST